MQGFRTARNVLIVALATFSSVLIADPNSGRVLPDMFTHLDAAKRHVETGSFELAHAHTGVVLLDTEVRVYAEGADSEHIRVVEEAVRLWEDAMDEDIDLVFVQSPDQATIVMHFQDAVYHQGRRVGGYITWRRGVKVDEFGSIVPNVRADIQVGLTEPNGRELGFDQLRHIAAHEFGHLLGLNDSRRGGIMSPLNLRRPALKPSQEEIEALRQLRESAMMVRTAALARIGR